MYGLLQKLSTPRQSPVTQSLNCWGHATEPLPPPQFAEASELRLEVSRHLPVRGVWK